MSQPPTSVSRLTARLQATAGRVLELLRETGSLELSPSTKLPGVSYSLFCVAVGCLLQGGRVGLAESGGTLRVQLPPAQRASGPAAP